MQTVLIALFRRYGQAEAAVRDLELAGLVGNEIEVVSDVDRDVRAEALGFEPHESIGERLSHALHGLRKPATNADGHREIHDDSGDMPDYIGEQEFYATHVKQEGAILLVRPPSPTLAEAAEAILKGHGSEMRDGKKGVLVAEEQGPPRRSSARGAA